MESKCLTKSDKAKNVDDLLAMLGTGRWNITIFVLASLSYVRIPPQVLSGAFIAPSVDYNCVLPANASLTSGNRVADPCHYWDSTGLQQQCTEWTFDTSTFESTLTSEYSLVCSRASLRSTYSSLYMFGAMFGSLIMGYLADCKGRKLAMTIGVISMCVIPFVLSWSPYLILIMICRFLLGVVHPIILSSFFALCMESCQLKHRSIVGVVSGLPWAVGIMAWGGMAYFIRSWRLLNTVASILSFAFLPCIWLMDESPRWLIVHGKHDEAVAVLRKAARINNAVLPNDEELMEIMKNTAKNASNQTATTENSNIKQCLKEIGLLFSNRQMRLRTFTMWGLFFVAAMVYYGLSLSATEFSADPFIYMILGGIMEVPSYTILVPIISKWGRKLPTAVMYGICGVTILSLAFTPTEISWLVMTLAMVGKLTITMSFQIICIYILELFPTEVRLQGFGTSVLFSRIASALTPYITNVAGNAHWVPSVIFGAFSLAAGLATFLLPETNGTSMPDTVQDLTIQTNQDNDRKNNLV